MSNSIDVKDYVLNINSFKEPITYESADAVQLLIYRLLLLDPGSIETHPDMGVGLVSKYRYASDEVIQNEMKKELIDQIRIYLPSTWVGMVDVRFATNDHVLKILTKIGDEQYSAQFNPVTGRLESTKVTLSDIT